MDKPEHFEVQIRIPLWSQKTNLTVNGTCLELDQAALSVNKGYVCLDRLWNTNDTIVLDLDMRTVYIKPISYGHQILMNQVIWGANYIVPTYDEEDPIAKNHCALRRGPVVLAQENRLGYSVDEPVDILVREDGYVDAAFPEMEIAPYEHILELEIPLANGEKMHVTDYASAGKLWTQESKMAAWMLITEPDIIKQ